MDDPVEQELIALLQYVREELQPTVLELKAERDQLRTENAALRSASEPVAWMWANGMGTSFDVTKPNRELCVPLYTAPQPAQSDAKDAERLDWIAKKFFISSWNGVVGSGSRVNWRIAGDHRHTTALMTESTFLDAIDQAMQGEEK